MNKHRTTYEQKLNNMNKPLTNNKQTNEQKTNIKWTEYEQALNEQPTNN
ncbi:MAG: hypothetical protein ACJ0OW_03710 [Flavobacteriaceae bacterium]